MNKVKKQQEKINNIFPFVPDGDFYFANGVRAFQKKKFDIATKWLNKAVEAEPENPLYKCQMSIVHTETGEYYLANELLKSVLDSSDYVDCYYLLANNYAHLGLLDEATKYVSIYLEKDPEGDFAEEALSLLELIDFDLDDDDFDEEWLLEEEDSLIQYQETAFYYMENEDWEKALPIIEEMLSLYPKHPGVKQDFTQALFYTGNKEDAIQIELNSVEKTNLLQSLMNLTLFYYETGNQKDYNEVLKKLRNIYPLHCDQQIKLAVTLAKTGNYRDAMERFKRVEPRFARGHLSYYKWYSIAAYYQGADRLSQEIWQAGCMRFRTLEDYQFPWMDN